MNEELQVEGGVGKHKEDMKVNSTLCYRKIHMSYISFEEMHLFTHIDLRLKSFNLLLEENKLVYVSKLVDTSLVQKPSFVPLRKVL